MPKEYKEQLFEEMYSGIEADTRGYVSRGDLITINGKSIREMMADDYRAEGWSEKEFDEYYKEKFKDKTKQYVQKALDDGEYVEVFSVGADGSITGEPQQLAVEGKEPAVPGEELQQKLQESRNLARDVNTNALFETDIHCMDKRFEEFFGDWMKEKNVRENAVSNHFKGNEVYGLFSDPKKEALIRTAIYYMVAENKYSIDDILDPQKLKEEKQRVGKLLMDDVEKRDYGYVFIFTMSAQDLLLIHMGEKMEQMDLSDNRELMSPENRKMFFAFHCAGQAVDNFNRDKEIIGLKYLSATSDGGKYFWKRKDPKECIKSVKIQENNIRNVQQLFSSVKASLNAQVRMRVCGMYTTEDLYTIIGAEQLRKKYHNIQKEYKRFVVSDEKPEKIPAMQDSYYSYKWFREYMQDPDKIRRVGGEFLSGNLQKNIKVDSKERSFTINEAYKKKIDPIWVAQREFEPKMREIRGIGYFFGYDDDRLSECTSKLRGSSEQYKDMHQSVKNVKKVVNEIKIPPTYEQYMSLKAVVNEAKEKTRAYLEYKQSHKKDTKYEKDRVKAAESVMFQCKETLKKIEENEQYFDIIPELREQKQQYEQKKQDEQRQQYEQKQQQIENARKNITFEKSLDAVLNENERQALTNIAAEFTDVFLQEVRNSIKELSDGNKGILTGSMKYANMQNSLSRMEESIEDSSNPVTSHGVDDLSRSLKELQDNAKLYLDYKEIPENRSGSDKEKQRIAAAKKVSALCEKMDKKMLEMKTAMVRPNKESTKQKVTEAVNKKYSSAGTSKEQQQLSGKILSDNDVYAKYIENPEDQAVKDTVVRHMAEMVAVEHLGIVRKRHDYLQNIDKNTIFNGLLSMKIENEEKSIADAGIGKYVDSIMQQKEFKEATDPMSPHKMSIFVLGNGAKDIAVKIDKQILKEASAHQKQKDVQTQLSNEKKLSNQNQNQNQKKSEPAKQAVIPGK